jgi:methionyl-tRNA formyltransferase
MRVALLSSSAAGIPVLQWLAGQQVLSGLGVLDLPDNEDIVFPARAIGIPVRQLTGAAFEASLEAWIKEVQPDIVLVIGCPYRIPERLLDQPVHGFYNVHFGALPVYGGSTPLFWQIRHQEKTGELTIHRMNARLDKGPVAVRLPLAIEPADTYGLLMSRYALQSVEGVYRLLIGLQQGTLTLEPQAETAIRFHPRPAGREVFIDWAGMNARQVEALVRACNPWNRGAIARLKGWSIKIVEAAATGELPGIPPGTLRFESENTVYVSCAEQTALRIDIVYAREGYFSGPAIARFGIRSGDRFDAL